MPAINLSKAIVVQLPILNLFIAFSVVSVPPVNTFAISPQQYCEVLEKKAPGTFEMLNLDTQSADPTATIKVRGSEYLGNLGSVVPYNASITLCGNTYNISGTLQTNPMQAYTTTSKILLSAVNPTYNACSGTSTGMTICAGATCFSATEGGSKALFANLRVPVPQPELGCVNAGGMTFKNGNSCLASDFRVTTEFVDQVVVVDGNQQTVQAFRLNFSATETATDSSTITKVKYCSRGVFHYATVRSGPLAQKNDSVISCILSTGEGTPKLFSPPPVQGELTTGIKNWLVNKGGCAP